MNGWLIVQPYIGMGMAIQNQSRNLVLAISGASGALYGVALLQAVAALVPGSSHVIISPAALRVYNAEFSKKLETVEDYLQEVLSEIDRPIHEFNLDDYRDIGARPASGSARLEGMVVAPCSMKSLAGIAQGYTTNLVERAADVCLKERRPLILMPRETPYSLVHLRNMTSLTEAGAIILPASPGFYQRPTSLEDLARFMTGRVFNLLGLEHDLFKPWDKDQEG